MNKIVIFVALVLVVSLVGCAQKQQVQTAPQQTPQQTAQQGGKVTFEVLPNITEVRISGFAFNPSNLTVSVGATVKWVNDDSAPHSITSENFKSGTLSNGDSYEFRFATPGIYDYSCSIHPSMKGTILVK